MLNLPMTVGMAAIANGDGTPAVVVSADKMLTTQQHSAIEHEHPETKLSKLVPGLQDVEILSVYAGSVSLAEDLNDRIHDAVRGYIQENRQNEESEPLDWDVRTIARIAAQEYRGLVQEKVENIVLSKYGLELDDLSAQHQFKDSFFNDVWAKVDQLEQEITQHLVLLMGGVDDSGAYVYEITNNDVTGHNDIGYATIGSGTQPAQSEFIKSNYGKSEDFETALATVTAANYRAKQARGVGGDVDIGVVRPNSTEFASDDTVQELKDRQEEIDDEQEERKRNILDDNDIEWRSTNENAR